ncbi:MAG: prepilin-type N-terminal cleavage/methylation domain-containing protein [Myxococcota bacterium]
MTSRRRGYTLVELVLVVALVSVLAGLFAPGLANVGKESVLRARAEALAGVVASARMHAISHGTLVAVAPGNSGKRLAVVAFDADETAYEENVTFVASDPDGMNWATISDANEVYLKNISFDITDATFALEVDSSVPAAKSVLVWRPNGWMRADNMGSATNPVATPSDDAWRINLSRSDLPAGQNRIQITVNPIGLICVSEALGASCP